MSFCCCPFLIFRAFMVSVVLALWSFVWWVYHFECKPLWQSVLLVNIFFVLAVSSYLRTAFTDPGSPHSPEWQAWESERKQSKVEEGTRDSIDGESEREREKQRWRPGEVTWCSESQAERPERAHFCSRSGYNVLRMDHYCPWVGNCIGWRNHKYFLLMCWWTFCTLLTVVFTARNPPITEVLSYILGKRRFPDDLFMESIMPLRVWIAGTLVSCFLPATGATFALSVRSACRNITSVEACFKGENPYEYPSCVDNAEQLLGSLTSWRLLLPIEDVRQCTGTSFPVVPKEKLAAELAVDNTEGAYGSC